MKKFLPVILLGMLLFFTACGGNEKADKNTQAVIDKVIEEDSVSVDFHGKETKHNYTQKDFSFLIYKDKDANNYLIDTWAPYKGKTDSVKHFYQFTEDKELKRLVAEYEFNEKKASGNYDLVYKSGKFKE